MPISVFHMFRFSWKHPIEAFKDLLRIVRYSYQRITKGYCDYDVGYIDIWFETIMPDMLRRLKAVQTGCPVEIFDEYFKSHCDGLNVSKKEFAYELQTNNELRQKVDDWSYSRWQEILEEMACAFEEMEHVRDTYGNLEELERCKNRALILFEKYYYCLWN